MPFRIALFDVGEESSAIAYDRPSFFLATLGRPKLKEFGILLDRKIDGIVSALRSKA